MSVRIHLLIKSVRQLVRKVSLHVLLLHFTYLNFMHVHHSAHAPYSTKQHVVFELYMVAMLCRCSVLYSIAFWMVNDI